MDLGHAREYYSHVSVLALKLLFGGSQELVVKRQSPIVLPELVKALTGVEGRGGIVNVVLTQFSPDLQRSFIQL